MTEKKEKPMDFKEMWKVSEIENPIKSDAETVFNEAKKAGWSEDLIFALISIFYRADIGIDYLDKEKPSREDFNKLQNKLAKHEHLPTGKAAEPL